MGCGGSKATQLFSDNDRASSLAEKTAKNPHKALDVRRRGTVAKLDEAQADAIASLFYDYRRQSASDPDSVRISTITLTEGSMFEGSQKVRKTMTKYGLRKILCDVDAHLFEHLWHLFDTTGDGTVSADEFVMAMAMLSNDVGGSSEAQLEAAFCMFDSDKSGKLSRDEFEKMVQTTVNLSLDSLLTSKSATHAFEAQLEKEFSHENLEFWQHVQDFKELEDGAARLTKARVLEREFVDQEAEKQVNLPGPIRTKLEKALKACTDEAPKDLFDAASEEIFKLMEKDTFSRFKQDEGTTTKLLEEFYASMGIKPTDSVPFKAFKDWAMQEPTVLVIFHSLCASISKIVRAQQERKSAGGTASSAAASTGAAASSSAAGATDGAAAAAGPPAPAGLLDTPSAAAAAPAAAPEASLMDTARALLRGITGGVSAAPATAAPAAEPASTSAAEPAPVPEPAAAPSPASSALLTVDEPAATVAAASASPAPAPPAGGVPVTGTDLIA